MTPVVDQKPRQHWEQTPLAGTRLHGTRNTAADIGVRQDLVQAGISKGGHNYEEPGESRACQSGPCWTSMEAPSVRSRRNLDMTGRILTG